MPKISIALIVACVAMLVPVRAAAPFELKDGDRVVFLGDTLIEREQHYGWIELMLTTRFPDRNVTFRNLGWSADLPNGESRLGLSLRQAGVEPEGEAWELLQKQIAETKPTVAFIGYGMAASFAGEAGLPKFKEDYNRLLDAIEKISPGCRLVLLGPVRHQWLPEPLPAPAAHNGQLRSYSEAIREIAGARKGSFVSLLDASKEQPAASADSRRWTDNGIHLTEKGYQDATAHIQSQLGLGDAQPWQSAPGAGLLRQVIFRKNEFYFHRSRPANMAYIFGFRKREQGKNAVEMPQFDPLIAKEEQKIRELCKHLNDPNFKPGPELQPAALLGKAAAAKHTPQPTPEFTVADGFEITLWAENPHLAKPIQINFDPQGRLWVASSEVYPQVEPGEAAHDKIIVLEDTTGTGKADKATVFAEGLLIPTGVIPGDGGCYVAQSTELLHFKQTDTKKFVGDQKRIVLSSFGTEDTHHNLHTLRWGPDGRLWMSQSIYTRSEVETPHGVVRLRSGGIFRFEPGTMKLEVVFKGWVNSWGHQFDEFGQSFMTDGAGGAGINWGLPGAMYVTYARGRRILGSVSPGGYPKFASIEIIRSEQFPADWQGRVITCDFRANRVTSFSITEQGAAYVTKQETDVCRTKNNTFRPIDVKLGPDGALYIADWSNPIINHGEVDFRDPRRDREHGRIWRVAAKGRPALKKPALATATTTALLNELLSPNHFNSSQATRVLVEKGAAAVAPELKPWTASLKDEKQLLNALWIHQALNQPAPELLDRLLAAQDGRIRAAAVRALSFSAALPAAPVRIADASGTVSTFLKDGGATFSDSETLARLAKAVTDPHPRVRVEAVRALGKIPTARSVELMLSAVDTIGTDNFLDYALWLSVNDLARPFLAALESGAWLPDSPAKQRQLEFALRALDPAVGAGSITKLLAAKPITKDGAGPWIELIGAAGGQAEINQLWEHAASGYFSTDEAKVRALTALASAARLRNVKPAGDGSRVVRYFNYATLQQHLAALNLMGAWKNPGAAFAEMVRMAGDVRTPAEVRAAVFAAFRELGAIPPVLGALQPLAAKTAPAPVRSAAATTLASLQPAKFASLAMEVLAETRSDAEALDLWRSLLTTKGMAKQLAPYVGTAKLPPAIALAGLRAAREGGQPEPTLIAALNKQSNLALSPEKLTPERLKAIADNALKTGDAARGERIYRRAELGCVLCHSIGGVGGKVGPDMTSLGASAPADYLVESVLVPNAKIKEGFHSIIVETKDDLEFSGILVRETGQELILRNAQNQEVSVAKNNLRKRSNGLSLMPAGLVDTLSEAEHLDLFRFLTELGKAGNYDASKGGVARVWQVLPGTSYIEQDGFERVIKGEVKQGWKPLLARVSGGLAAEDIAEIGAAQAQRLVTFYASAQFTVAKAGPVTFELEGVTKPEVWIDGEKARDLGASGPKSALNAMLKPGPHTIVLRLDARQLPEQFKLRCGDVVWAQN